MTLAMNVKVHITLLIIIHQSTDAVTGRGRPDFYPVNIFLVPAFPSNARELLGNVLGAKVAHTDLPLHRS